MAEGESFERAGMQSGPLAELLGVAEEELETTSSVTKLPEPLFKSHVVDATDLTRRLCLASEKGLVDIIRLLVEA